MHTDVMSKKLKPRDLKFKVPDALVRMSVYLPADRIAALKEISERTGAPVAELIRRAVAEFLRRG